LLQEIVRLVLPFYLHKGQRVQCTTRQTTANYIVSQLAVWEIDFPGGIRNDNFKWRALIWAMSEVLLVIVILLNRLPRKHHIIKAFAVTHITLVARMYSNVFKFSMGLMIVDFLLCLIWLPIGASRTYGFRSAKDVFTLTCTHCCFQWPSIIDMKTLDNGTGAPPGWNWILSLLVILIWPCSQRTYPLPLDYSPLAP